MTGINRFDLKQRRQIRRRNHIAKDLREPQFRQIIIESKRNKRQEEKRIMDGVYEDDE